MKKVDKLLINSENTNLDFTGERYVPRYELDEITIEHTQRYCFASELVKGKVVLDAACGEGYGSHILKQNASEVYSIDLDQEVIDNANKKYTKDNIKFKAASIEKLPFEDNIFDVVVSFETIEHVGKEIQEAFLKEISRVLKKDGILIISTPNKLIYTDRVLGENIYHKKEFYRQEFLDFLCGYFRYTRLFNQYFKLGYFLDEENTKRQVEFNSINSDESRYYVAICSNNDINLDFPEVEPVFNNDMYFDLNKNCNSLNRDMVKVNNDFKDFRDESREYITHLENDIRLLNSEILKRDELLKDKKSILDIKSKELIKVENILDDKENYINKLELNIKQLSEKNLELQEQVQHPIKNIIRKIYFGKK